ncbi:MAG: SUMF1/EgtB/PvdO family nonheme iron enzyme [Elusimicrobia bacterium]|nr:SUMF1/EgtB/PvdO family nonheme iron enzyme [Elusimicrobiota bacterium]
MGLRSTGVKAVVISVLAACAPARAQDVSWPDLAQPVQAVGGGEGDAAVVVGIEGYAFVGPVAGAESNAKLWNRYLADTRGVPPRNVKLLTGVDATREEVLDAARKAASRAGPAGTLWFVFIGHGAPAKDGQDGLLLGVDAQQKAESLEKRGVRRGELLKILSTSRAGAIRVVLDACFSGKRPDGSSLAPNLQPLLTVASPAAVDPRLVVLTAAKGDQFAGPLPGVSRPAFSYLALGGLRGWAGQGRKGAVTAGDLRRYAADALDATLRGRNQTPDLIGKEDAVVAVSAGEAGPNLSRLAEATAGGGAREEMFKISSLPAVPNVQAPEAIKDLGGGADWRDLDVDALGRYDEAAEFDKGDASAAGKAAKWRELAAAAPKFAEKALGRARQWERFVEELAAQEQARVRRAEARDKDWLKLGKLLAMKTAVPEADKKRWALMFVQAYGKTSEENPYVEDVAKYLPPGTVKVTPGARAAAGAASTASSGQAGKAGIEWVTVPGGTFTMGSDDWAASKPRHAVTVKTFQLAKTEATNKQYRACVEAGACTPKGTESYCTADSPGDDQPVVCVNWEQARAFAAWVGGRLPTEAEWEYAARSAGKERKYPWGDEEASCGRAVMSEGGTGTGCGRHTAWPVCSKPVGNTEQGLCDMAGNVWEWTRDWRHDSYEGAPADGSAWESPAGSGRVVRGASWWSGTAENSRAAYRSDFKPDIRGGIVGFRPAR